MRKVNDIILGKIYRSRMDEYEKVERFRKKIVRKLFLALGAILLAGVTATAIALYIVAR